VSHRQKFSANPTIRKVRTSLSWLMLSKNPWTSNCKEQLQPPFAWAVAMSCVSVRPAVPVNCQGVWAAPVLDSAPGGFNLPTPNKPPTNKFYFYFYFLSSPQPPPAAADRHSGLGGQQGKIAILFQTPGRLAPPFSYTYFTRLYYSFPWFPKPITQPVCSTTNMHAACRTDTMQHKY
jgi:hypothetical protein